MNSSGPKSSSQISHIVLHKAVTFLEKHEKASVHSVDSSCYNRSLPMDSKLPDEALDLMASYEGELARREMSLTCESNQNKHQLTQIFKSLTNMQKLAYLRQAIEEGASAQQIRDIQRLCHLTKEDRQELLLFAATYHHQGAVHELASKLSSRRIDECFEIACMQPSSYSALPSIAATGRISQRVKDDCLQDIAGSCSAQDIKNLVSAGANPHVNFDSALCMACSFGNLEVVDFFIRELGADINAQSGRPLIEACRHGHLPIVNELIACGVDLEADRGTPLVDAISSGQIQLVDILLTAGAELTRAHVTLAEAVNNYYLSAKLSRWLNNPL